jgi:hypothetical protein
MNAGKKQMARVTGQLETGNRFATRPRKLIRHSGASGRVTCYPIEARFRIGRIEWWAEKRRGDRLRTLAECDHLVVYMVETQNSTMSIACPHCKRDLTEAEIRSILGRFARAKRLSSIGASRFANMTPEQRSAEARKAAQARWARRAEPHGM